MDSAASSISPAGPISRSHDEVDLLVQVARQCAIALEASIAYRELSELKEKTTREELYWKTKSGLIRISGTWPGNRPAFQAVLRSTQIVA